MEWFPVYSASPFKLSTGSQHRTEMRCCQSPALNLTGLGYFCVKKHGPGLTALTLSAKVQSRMGMSRSLMETPACIGQEWGVWPSPSAPTCMPLASCDVSQSESKVLHLTYSFSWERVSLGDVGISAHNESWTVMGPRRQFWDADSNHTPKPRSHDDLEYVGASSDGSAWVGRCVPQSWRDSVAAQGASCPSNRRQCRTTTWSPSSGGCEHTWASAGIYTHAVHTQHAGTCTDYNSSCTLTVNNS